MKWFRTKQFTYEIFWLLGEIPVIFYTKGSLQTGFPTGKCVSINALLRLFALTYPNGAPKRDEWVGFHCLFTHVSAVPAESLNIWEGGGHCMFKCILCRHFKHQIQQYKSCLNSFLLNFGSVEVPLTPYVCYKKFVTHLLLYTVVNVSRIFRNRRY